MMALVFAGLLVIYVAAQAIRFGLALAFLRRPLAPPVAEADITVLQPILSGDPLLAACLRTNQDQSPQAQFLLLVDEDDADGCAIAASLQSLRTRMIVGPPPRQGQNPKTAKLARALGHVQTPFIAVLDDDTVLPRGALAGAAGALTHADLVTALPFYAPSGGLWSRLVAGFVNGAALITYPPAAQLGASRTINGMFYVTRTKGLSALGGFAAIRTALTDDYAIAKLYLDAGCTLAQTPIVHPIHTTVRDARHYFSLMRRWMIFAGRYVRENTSWFTIGLIGGPTLIVPALIVAAFALGPWAIFLSVLALFGKAAAMAWLRGRYGAPRSDWRALAVEPIADLLTPLHLLAASIAPQRFAWRGRNIHMRGETIGYD
jgi:ceramide glucosyltransferase